MTITITAGIQKGGCSKSTTIGVLAHLLSEDGHRVLVADLDSQGNVSELLSQKPSNEFIGRSVLEALQELDPRKYIYTVNENIDLLPANNFLATFQRWLYTGKSYKGEYIPYKGNPSLVLEQTLNKVRDNYDFILIDTAPSLSETTTNALCASDYVIVMFECSNWCYSAIPNFMDSIEVAQEVSERGVTIAGILRTMNDVRRSDSKAFNEMIEEDYPEVVFDTILTRKAPIGRISLYGFESNRELTQALEQYKNFYKELMQRVKN
ncbi:ParA family protein [Bacillus solitudinis]|uniref:ParA family protein n=1 Tax=Bacillus solitudinis TaxID=2014074 RepID=UPI000C24F4E2|nr:ParA family protein [Bacillus solitudinis]